MITTIVICVIASLFEVLLNDTVYIGCVSFLAFVLWVVITLIFDKGEKNV